jgi:hypothetical protein
VSADALPTWQINGVVWSQVLVNNILYATGSFTKARPPGVAVGGAGEIDAQNIFAYDIRTGERVASFNHSLNAQGLTITASPDGSRVYVGGDFTTVDGFARGHVASFRTASGALDLNFRPTVQGPVTALAVSNTKVYVGGSFATVNGVARTSLAALDAINGSDLGWAPAIDSGPASRIWSMVLAPDRSRVIVGGSFTALNGTPAYGMGALNATTGATMPWAANQVIRDAGEFGAIYSLRADSTQIYGSGYSFQDKSTTNFEGTFAADPKTGNITLVNDCLGDTYDVLPLGPVLYSVGHAHNCSYIGSFPDTSPTTSGRVRWQRALAQTIAPTRVNTGPDAYGWNYSGRPASTVLHWFPQLSAGTYTGSSQGAWSIVGNDNYVALGGEFPSVNGMAQQGLVRMAVRAIAPNQRGPTYNTLPTRPIPPTTATSTASGAVDISFGTAWDNDNETLKYDLFRNGGLLIYSTTIASNFWTLPTVTYTDTSLAPGATAYYQVRITDPYGNTLWSLKSSTVTGCCTAGVNVAQTKKSQVLRVGTSSAGPRERAKRIYVDPEAASKYRPVRRQGKSGKAVPASSTLPASKAILPKRGRAERRGS